MAGREDRLARAAAALAAIEDWRAFLSVAPSEAELASIRRHQRTGRPLGDDGFVADLERCLGRALKPNKLGPKPGAPKRSAEPDR